MLERDLVLPNLIAKRAAETPDAPFIQDVEGPEATFSAFDEGNRRWADAYRRLGVQPGDRVVTMLPSSIDSYHAWLGLGWLNAIEVPINNMHRGRMLRYQVDHSDAEVIVMAAEFLDRLPEVADGLGTVKTVVVPDSDEVTVDLPFRVVTQKEFLGAAEPATDFEGPEGHDIACMIYTSGTTGPSKGVLDPWALLYHFPLGAPEDGLKPGDGYYSIWPPYHVSGKVTIYLAAVRNVRLVMRTQFSATHFLPDVRAYNCTMAGLVGPLAQFMLLIPEEPDDADNPLVGVTCGPLFPQIEDFMKRFGVKMSTGYGMTEIGAPFATEGWTISDWRSCGRLRSGPPGYEARVVDARDEPLGPGEVGELVVRSDEPWVLNAGYYNMPDKTAEAWRNGWFHTGDGFMYDEEGNYFFVDRMKDAIRRRGENISSFEVEGYVKDHPDVAEVAAIGVPSEYGEDEVKICVVRKPESELTADDLVRFLIPNMPRFMVPRYVEFVDALPKTEATARTKKGDLRQNPLNESTWDREEAGIAVPR